MLNGDTSLQRRGGSIDRRAFLRASLVAGASLSAVPFAGAGIRSESAARGLGQLAGSRGGAGSAQACILVWLRGGVPQTDTWDPKRFTPFRRGMRASELLGTCPSIPTAVDGVRFGEGLERIASVMDRGAVVRSLVTDRGGGSAWGAATHLRAERALFCGASGDSCAGARSTASCIATLAGRGERHLPSSIWIGRAEAPPTDEAVDHFMVPDPDAILAAIDASARSARRAVDPRARAIAESRARAAFDLAAEAPSVQHRYDPSASEDGAMTSPGRRGAGERFARGLLLARRLVEHGARVVQVEYPFQPFAGFDLHEHGGQRIAALKRTIDGPLAALVRDLESRGLLRDTLVVVASEFGRTVGAVRGEEAGSGAPALADDAENVLWSERAYGFHRHFGECSAALLFGGGIEPGLVRGRSAERHPMVPIESPLTMAELHATIRARLGVANADEATMALG